MILIADSGSTKTEWCLLEGDSVVLMTTGSGLNPYYLDAAKIAELIAGEVIHFLPGPKVISHVFFYGAGCSNDENSEIIKQGLRVHFPEAKLDVISDMIGAARALCGNGPGFVAILGTGSNSCAYAEGKIIQQNPSLGFILGDEGSGSDLGKKLLQSYFYKEMNPEISNAFREKYKISLDMILENVYRKPLPNRFVASFAPFIFENQDEQLNRMVEDSFASFLKKHIKTYTTLPPETPVYVTGSVAYVFRDILRGQIHSHQLVYGNILKSPMEGLIKYHSYKKDIS